MEPIIGVFPSRAEAEQALRELLEQDVPTTSIVWLTDADSEREACAQDMGRFVGAFVGFGTGFSLGVIGAFLLALNQTWQLLVLGFGAASILSLACAFVGGALCKATASYKPKLANLGTEAKVSSQYISKVLKQGNFVIMVSSDSFQVASEAKAVLHRSRVWEEAEAARGAA